MNWLEVISLRTTGNAQEVLDPGFMALLTEVSREPGVTELKLFLNATLETDLTIHLLWNSPGYGPRGSPVGQRLVLVLREFGLTNHTMWKEEERG